MDAFDARTRALLAAIREHASVSAAARALAMDASNALRHVRAAERRAGARLVERARGGRAGGRAALTAAGAALLAAFAEGAREDAGERVRWLARAEAFDEEEGVTPLAVGARRRLFAAGRVPPGPCVVTFRPEDVALERPAPRSAHAAARVTSVRNAWHARVTRTDATPRGVVRVTLESGTRRFTAVVTRGAVRALRLRRGSRVVASVKATALVVEPVA